VPVQREARSGRVASEIEPESGEPSRVSLCRAASVGRASTPGRVAGGYLLTGCWEGLLEEGVRETWLPLEH